MTDYEYILQQAKKARYKKDVSDDRVKISIAFRNSSAGDISWVEHQERKELYGELK